LSADRRAAAEQLARRGLDGSGKRLSAGGYLLARWQTLEIQKAQQPVRNTSRSPLRRQSELGLRSIRHRVK
jgi:hypothetical protein